MAFTNDLIESLGESVQITCHDECSLKGMVLEAGIPFFFEITIGKHIAKISLMATGLGGDLLEQLVEKQQDGICSKTGSIHLDKNVYLSGDQKGDVWIVSQWLMVLIDSFGDALRKGRTSNETYF